MDSNSIKNHIISSQQKSISYQEYKDLTSQLTLEGKTTGSNQSEDLIHYTKLNHQRSKRIEKTYKVQQDTATFLQKISTPQHWIVITESWCGDAANILPIIAAMASVSPNIHLHIVLRDENLELMDHFLTNGGRSIPKLIAYNDQQEVLFDWGPRPTEAQNLFLQWRAKDPRPSFHDFHIEIQHWYNKDKGLATEKEILSLLTSLG